MDSEVPQEWRLDLWGLIDKTPNLLWQLLTKRPHLYSRFLPENGFAHDNVILGATMESQVYYDERMPRLYDAAEVLRGRNNYTRGSVAGVQTFVSYEPAIGPLTMSKSSLRPNWLIFGGETGCSHQTRRSCDVAWAENIKAECEAYGVSFFMKQMSARTPAQAAELIPAHLLVRNFPEVSR